MPQDNPTTAIARPPVFRRVIEHVLSVFFDRRHSVSRPIFLFTVALCDAGCVAISGIASAWITGAPQAFSAASLAGALVLGLIVCSVLHRQWSYTIHALRQFTPQCIKIATSLYGVFLTLAGLAYLFDIPAYGPRQLVCWIAIAMAAMAVVRWITRETIETLSRSGSLVRRTVIVGGGKDTDDLIAALGIGENSHLRIFGIFDDRSGERCGAPRSAITRLGTFDQLAAFCRDEGIDLLIVTVPPRAEDRLMQILQQLFTLQIDIRVSALNSKLRLNSSAYSYIGKVPMLAVMDKPLSDWDRVIKNVEDRVIGLVLLTIAVPVMALVALAVRLDSPGPILFRQKRYGFNNELIEVYKFRSMYTGDLDAAACKLVTKNDSRVTPVGRFIRRTSLDELPQLFNVLRGEMSLVGPRPHATQAKAGRELYEDVVHGYFARHRVKPGVTGWAQVNGWRGETDTREKLERRIEHDIHYIDNWSVALDLYIIALTPFALISGKNAY
ncbi:MAG: undecaprenyl-phosphate glucose phosphotransferase [Hyphomicrobiaceae bacterium]